jgi:hypothetical protein
MTDKLTFYPYHRAPMLSLATSRENGRLRGALPLTLADATTGQPPQTGTAPFLFYGARDIARLKDQAIRLVAPRPSVSDAETTKLVHVDLADPDLPWRYPSFVPGDGERRPWLVVVVGPASDISIAGETGAFKPDVLEAHPLSDSHLWAHVQESGGRLISRIISPYELAPLTSYIAAIVPAFDLQGDPSWQADGSLTDPDHPLPVLFSWRFATGEEGDFETLAAALRVRNAGDLGKTRIIYRRDVSGIAVDLEGRGAITSLQTPLEQTEPASMSDDALLLALRDTEQLLGGIDPATLSTDQKRAKLTELRDAARADIATARDDLDALNQPVEDIYTTDPDLKRAFIELPAYGRPWAPEPESMTWGNTLNDDPRYRGVSGIGLRMGILAQAELMAAAVAQAGALSTASLRAADLALGLAAAASLWTRLLPDDPARQLGVFGPALGRMPTSAGGTVLEEVTSDRTWLDRASLSSAARRVLRDGTGKARQLAVGGIDRAQALDAANGGPRPATDTPSGLPHLDGISGELEGTTFSRKLGIEEWPAEIWQVVRRYSGRPLDLDLIDAFVGELSTFGLPCEDYSRGFLGEAMERGARVATCELLAASIQRCLIGLAGDIDIGGEIDRWEISGFVSELLSPPCPPERGPIDLGGLAGAVGGVIDPTRACPPAARRVDSTVKGLDLCPPHPPELPIRLDVPTWTLLNQHDKEWLLPGAGSLEKHSVVALQTNPTFIDAFMVGINTQFMNEMRWRGLAADRSITPLRMFWGQMNYETNKRGPDIQPIGDWTNDPNADLGDLSHQVIKPGDTTGRRDLIILFRTPLFRRYPGTVVYLVNKNAGTPAQVEERLKTTPLFTHQPTETRPDRPFFGPIFRGALEPDLHFFAFDVDPGSLDGYWLVLDEPPAELRFRAKRPNGADSVQTAKAKIDQPTRVAIDGAAMEQAGLL